MLDKRYKKAIEKLIVHYEQFEPLKVEDINYEEYCPLCEVDGEIMRELRLSKEICTSCPWVVYSGSRCHASEYEYQSAGQRIDRLKGYLTKMEEEDETGH